MATCAAFFQESRMKFADPTSPNRKSGVARGVAQDHVVKRDTAVQDSGMRVVR